MNFVALAALLHHVVWLDAGRLVPPAKTDDAAPLNKAYRSMEMCFAWTGGVYPPVSPLVFDYQPVFAGVLRRELPRLAPYLLDSFGVAGMDEKMYLFPAWNSML